jgi:hypothetical protein
LVGENKKYTLSFGTKSLGKQLFEWMVDDIKFDNWDTGCDM